MKREYKLSSIIIMILISAVVSFITSSLFQAIAGESELMIFVGQIIIMVLTLIFEFAMSSGLIRNRMGSVGEYLNQVNYINGKIILINILVKLVLTFIISLASMVGGAFAFFAFASQGLNGGGTIGMILLILAIFIFTIIYSLLITYTNFYLADFYVGNGQKPGLGQAIKDIFKIGKDLLAKTFIIYLKAIIVPILLLLGIFALGFMTGPDFGMGKALVLTLIVIVLAVYSIVVGGIILARLSDRYLDYMEVNRAYFER
ncbi:MAG: hypothetical protein Q4D88_00200 [Anaerococcus sp.]|nr:hypothetical protein [Anaerococcus sp.]